MSAEQILAEDAAMKAMCEAQNKVIQLAEERGARLALAAETARGCPHLCSDGNCPWDRRMREILKGGK